MYSASSPRQHAPHAAGSRLPLVCVHLAALFCAGCGPRETPVAAALESATLLYGNGSEPQELDPHLTTGSAEAAIQGTLFEGLVVPDPRTGKPRPAAARSWEASPDGRIVTFALRPDGRWSDGTAVTEERMFRAGQLHHTAFVPAAKMAQYRREHPELLRSAPEARNYYYVFNVNRPPFGDVRVRRALALAIDRERLVTTVLRGGQTPARRFAPPVLFSDTVPETFAEDVATARELLAAAGFPNGAGLPVIPLLINNTERNRLIAEAVQEMWRRQLGIRLEIVLQEWKVYLDSLKQGDYHLSFDGWGFLTAQQFYSLLTTGNSASYNLWSDPAYDHQVAAAAAESDPARRNELYAELEAHLARVMPVAPIYFNASNHLVRPEVQGWYTNPHDSHHLPAVSLGR